MELNNENCIEWLSGQHNIICSISQQKYITKIKKLAENILKKLKSNLIKMVQFVPNFR